MSTAEHFNFQLRVIPFEELYDIDSDFDEGEDETEVENTPSSMQNEEIETEVEETPSNVNYDNVETDCNNTPNTINNVYSIEMELTNNVRRRLFEIDSDDE